MKVFSIKKYIDHLFRTNDENFIKKEMIAFIKKVPDCWEYRCEGMTEEEMTSYGFMWNDDWAEEVKDDTN